MAITLNQHRKGITQALIARFSDDLQPREGLSAYFPTKTTPAKQVSIEVERNLQTVAVDVQRCTDPVRNIFSKSTEKIFTPPYFNEAFDFTSCERYDVTFGRGEGPNAGDASMIIGDADSHLKKLKNKITRAIEIQRSQVLQTGIVVLKNGDSIDYKRKAGSMPVLAGTAKWDAPTTSTPLKDLETGMNFLREEGLSGGSTINAVFGQNAFNNFMASTSVKELADWRRINRLEINMPQFNNVSGMAFQGQIGCGDYIVNIWTYNNYYNDPVTGTKTKYIDTNNVIMVPDDFVGFTAFAGLPAVMDGSDGSAYIAPVEAEFLVRNIVDQVKLSWDFIVSSAPLVIPVSIDRIYTIKTA